MNADDVARGHAAMAERIGRAKAPVPLVVDLYARATPAQLAHVRNHRVTGTDDQLRVLDEYAHAWRSAGYLVAWVAPGVLVATDDTMPLTVRHIAVSRDPALVYPFSPDDAHGLVGTPDGADKLRRLQERYRRDNPDAPHLQPSRALTTRVP